MLLWSPAPNATRVDFSVIGLSPYTGLVLSILDGRLHDRAEFDPPSFIFPSTRRFPAPASDVFFIVLDETFLPDGRYLVNATSNAVGALTIVYEIVIRDGIQVDFPGPPGFTPPPFCVVTGAEFDPAGNPLMGVRVTAFMEAPHGSMATWGSVAGVSETVSDVSGAWSLPLAPSALLMPKSTYRIVKRHTEFGIVEAGGIFIPSLVATRKISALIVESAIRKMEIIAAPPAIPIATPSGYITITGKVVNVVGVPMASVPVTIGTGYWDSGISAIPKAIGSSMPQNLYAPEGEFTVTTPVDKVLTVSAFPDAPITTTTIPAGSEIISISDGYGNTFGPPDVTYDPLTGILTFAMPFVGVVRYRVPSDGTFSVAVPMPGAFWIRVGLLGERHPFTIYGGITAFDVGRVVLYPSI